MNCANCSEPLHERELSQTYRLDGREIRPPSFCDDCCRSVAWVGGSSASLERLVRGEVDPVEQARLLADLGPTWPLT